MLWGTDLLHTDWWTQEAAALAPDPPPPRAQTGQPDPHC